MQPFVIWLDTGIIMKAGIMGVERNYAEKTLLQQVK